jgi:hypothetical protein
MSDPSCSAIRNFPRRKAASDPLLVPGTNI